MVRGWAAESLLDSYEQEREPVGRRNATRSRETGIGTTPESTLAADFGVTYDSDVIVNGRTGKLPFDEIGQRARPGDRAPHEWLDLLGKRLSTIDLFDSTLTLLTGAAGGAWRSAVAALPADLPFQVLSVGSEIYDPAGQLVERYGLAGDRAVLIRPDGYVTWIGQDADGDAFAALRRAVTRSLGQSLKPADQLVSVA